MSLQADATLQLIEARQSVGQLLEPAPSEQQLAQAVQAALAAPDHHRLRPWLFLRVQGDARQQLGELLVQVLQAQGETDLPQLERVRKQPLRAPLIVVAVNTVQDHPKVPVFEQLLSSGAAVQNLLLMLQAQGFAAIWRTGALIDAPLLKSAFGLKTTDQVVGFIYIGTAARELPARNRLSVGDFLVDWPATSTR